MDAKFKMDVHNGKYFVRDMDASIEEINNSRERWVTVFDELNSLIRSTEVNNEILRLQTEITRAVSNLLSITNDLRDYTDKQILAYTNTYDAAKSLIEAAIERIDEAYSSMKERGI